MIYEIFNQSWIILLESAPYMLLGFFAAGLIKGFLPDDFITRHLGAAGPGAVIKAALVGAPIPLCSCGVVPAAAGIKRQGATNAATASFLIATPETGLDSVAVTWSLMDPLMAVIRFFAAIITAIVAGLGIQALGKDEPKPVSADTTCNGAQCSCGAAGHKTTLAEKFKHGMKYAFGEILADVGKWFIIGVFLAGIISALLPAGFIEDYLGHGLTSMLIMLAASMPMYVCATSSTPIAAALVLKGLSPGAALVFLLAGPATNAASLTVVSRILGCRGTAIYLAAIAGCSIGLGSLADALYAWTGLELAAWAGKAEQTSNGIIPIASAALLIGLIAWSFARERLGRSNRCQEIQAGNACPQRSPKS